MTCWENWRVQLNLGGPSSNALGWWGGDINGGETAIKNDGGVWGWLIVVLMDYDGGGAAGEVLSGGGGVLAEPAGAAAST